MSNNPYKYIENWTAEDLDSLPNEETVIYEYKSSNTPLDKLKEKLAIAASAFWNSGGGIFIAGVNDTGVVDGGIPATNGRQKISDWADQALNLVEPAGPYTIKAIRKTKDNSSIKDKHAVLVVAFGESSNPPHMAPDRKYYIRAGAHSGPANHFLVEALRLQRGFQSPQLRGFFQFHHTKPDIVQLAITSINHVAAINVRINFNPVPNAVSAVMRNQLPLHIPVISQEIPFVMDISHASDSSGTFGQEPTELQLEYDDLSGRAYSHKQILHPKQNFAPLRIKSRSSSSMQNEELLQNISEQLERLIKALLSNR